MRSSRLGVLALLCATCTGGDGQRASSPGDSNQSATKDAAMADSRYLIVELRWTQVIDRHPTPDEAAHPRVETVETEDRFEDLLRMPDYANRPADQRPEIHQREWMLAIPESFPSTFELTVDGTVDHRVIVFSRGWKEIDGVVTPAVVMKSNWEIDVSSGDGGGPNQVGLGATALSVRQASRAISKRTARFGYFEFMESRYDEIVAIPPSGAIAGHADTIEGQVEKERTWPIKVVELP